MESEQLDNMMEDFNNWKSSGYKDAIPGLIISANDAIGAAVQFGFQAGWEARDKRPDSSMGKPSKAKRKEGRKGLGEEDIRHDATKQRKKVASESRCKKRRVSG